MKRVARLLERVVEKGGGDLEETIRRICICEPVTLNIVIIAVQTKGLYAVRPASCYIFTVF